MRSSSIATRTSESVIAVASANGRIGAATARALLEQGYLVRALVRRAAGAQDLMARGAQVCAGALADNSYLKAALRGVDALLLAMPASADMVERDSRVIEVARNAGVSRIVRVSVFGAATSSEPNLTRLHRSCERVLEDSGVAFTHIRPQVFMQELLGTGSIRIR